MNIYNSNLNSKAYTCLNRLTISHITSGKRINNIDCFTTQQALLIQKLANQLNHDKDVVIAYNK